MIRVQGVLHVGVSNVMVVSVVAVLNGFYRGF